MPFGEELNAGTPNRSEAQKYNLYGNDNIRKRFTGYEKDTETGLDFAEARYYQNKHGRFTAVDPLLASGKSANPQTFNRYVYVGNNPIVFNDPSGLNANNPWGVKEDDPYVKWFDNTGEMQAQGYSQVATHSYKVDGNYVVLDPNSNNLLVTPDRRAAMGKHFVYNGFPWYIEYTPASPVFYTVAHNMSGDPLGALGSFGAGAATDGVMGGLGKFFFGGARVVTRSGGSGLEYAKGVLEGGTGKAFAGHGEYIYGSGKTIIPEGTTLTTPRDGIRILDQTGRFMERGDWDGLARASATNPRIANDIRGMVTHLPGSEILNYTLRTPDDLVIHANSITVNQRTQLNNLLRSNQGCMVWAACMK